MPASKRLRDRPLLRTILRALRSRNYRLFCLGQGVSFIGTWMTRVATSWLVYRLTGSVLLLGIVDFAGQVPAFLLAPISGVLADRWNRHRILVITQALSMLESFVLAALALTGRITIGEIILLNTFQGFVNAVDIPMRQSFVVDMVERKEDLSNAIALNSSVFNGARLIGPSIAGLLIAAAGEGMCFLIDGVSYLAAIAALLAMRLPPWRKPAHAPPIWDGVAEGLRYAFGFPPIRSMLLLLGLVSLMGMPYSVLMPVMAKNILRGGPHTLGFLMAASGLGALVGALMLAARNTVLGLGRVIVASGVTFGVGLAAFSLSRFLPLSLLLMVVTGFGMMSQMAASNTIIQTLVPDELRGRVMSLYAIAVMGMATLGSLFAGAAASRLGTPHTLAIGGVACLAGSLVFSSRLSSIQALVRPIEE